MAIKNPRKNLSDTQNETLNSFIIKLNANKSLTESQLAWANEECLVRYLRARDFNLEKAYKMLMATLEWRKTFKPHALNPKELKEQATSGKCYVHGHDEEGRPFIVMTPRRENSDNWEQNIKWTMYVVERAIRQMGPNQEKLNLLIDFEGFSRKNSPPMWVSKEILANLSNHYPERLGRAYFVSTPMIFSFFWNIIKQFVDPVTKAKVMFVNGKNRAKQLVASGIAIDQIEDRFGGSLAQPEMVAYWQAACDKYDESQKQFAQRSAYHVRTASNTSLSSVGSLD